jgi:hypothetical protein
MDTNSVAGPGGVGRVVGTEDATPLRYWLALGPGCTVQLDDVVMTDRLLPDGTTLTLSGVVTQVRARHEGARFDSDVFLIEDGVLPAQVSETAEVMTTRAEPDLRPAAAGERRPAGRGQGAGPGAVLRPDGGQAADRPGA